MDPQSSNELPLTGIRVIDVATVIAAPYCASILGEFGAEVLKVEHPVGGDACRHFGTPTGCGKNGSSSPDVAAEVSWNRQPQSRGGQR